MTAEGANASEPAGMGGIAILVRRPVLAAAISLLIVVAGLAALIGVEVRELPDTDTPVVTVTTTYPGAAAETIDTEITSLVEGAVSRVEGVRRVSSSSSYGRSRITLEFGVGVDLNVAAQDVREAAAQIERELPDDADPPLVAKADADADPIMRLTISSQSLSKDALTQLVDDLIVDRLAAVEGVAQVDTYGAQPRILEVRVRLIDLAARGLSIEDVENALSTVSINAAAGALESADQSIIVRTLARANTPEAIEALEITPETKIGDIGFVRWTLEDAASLTRANGGDAVGLSIIRQAQSNTIQISSAVRAEAARLRDELPGDVILAVTTDDAVFIQGSIREVATSLVLATVIVILVIFLFLRSARATLAPALAIPISILGAIAAIWLAGFSINIISLLALVVATGIVVDDAIVVLENIVRWRRKGVGPMAAAALGAREIVFAVLSTTAVLAAVFIPISFLPGKAGGVFAEFGFVLAFAVAVSSVVALTLCPMVAARVVGSIEPDPDQAQAAGARPAYSPGIA
ncbi:MAG: efflux RND transporter permease subunit, partial [Pseudomonadota bacterium]